MRPNDKISKAVDAALEAALASLQSDLGITDGALASVYWQGTTYKQFYLLMRAYAEAEKARKLPVLALGARVILTRAVERYPYVLLTAGIMGTVVASDSDSLRIYLDLDTGALDDWNNCLVFTPGDDDHDALQVIAVPN